MLSSLFRTVLMVKGSRAVVSGSIRTRFSICLSWVSRLFSLLTIVTATLSTGLLWWLDMFYLSCALLAVALILQRFLSHALHLISWRLRLADIINDL